MRKVRSIKLTFEINGDWDLNQNKPFYRGYLCSLALKPMHTALLDCKVNSQDKSF